MWRSVIVGILLLLPGLALGQDLSLPFPGAVLQQYTVPSCDQLGCNRQVIEPGRALKAYGLSYGPSGQWVSRVQADRAYQADGDGNTPCGSAVKALFKLVCGDDNNCEIEARYDDKCLSNSTDQDTAQACVNVVGAYVRQCFGKGCPGWSYDRLIGGALKNDGEEVSCSGSGFIFDSSGRRGEPVVVTVAHCESEIRAGTWIVRHPPSAVDQILGKVDDSSQKHFGSKIRAYEVKRHAIYPLGLGRPVAFATTYFQGFNSLIDSHNKVIDRSSVNGQKYGPLLCDSSPLCTIVKIDSGKVLHTCQTTMGGSGGALFQEIDGTTAVVAVNNGSPSKGQVSENDGLQILK